MKHTKSIGKVSCWIINSVIQSKYNPLTGSNYIKLPKKYPKKFD